MEREQYVDVLRGFCILVVVMQHVGLNIPIPGLFVLDTAVACFYFISGFFFERSASKCNGMISFLKKKSKRLLIPFVLWYFLSYAMFYGLKIVVPSLSLGRVEYHGLEDLFLQRVLFNGPIWFVLSLFYVEVLYFLVRNFSTEKLRFLIVVALSWGGYMLYKHAIIINPFLDGVFMALLFFYAGIIANKLKIENLLNNKPWWVETVIVIITYSIYVYMDPFVVFRDNSFPSGYFTSVMGLLSIVFCLFVASHLFIKRVELRLRFLPWFGVNSLVVLCAHHLIYRPAEFCLSVAGFHSSIIVLILTLVITAIIILFINRYFPLLAGRSQKSI